MASSTMLAAHTPAAQRNAGSGQSPRPTRRHCARPAQVQVLEPSLHSHRSLCRSPPQNHKSLVSVLPTLNVLGQPYRYPPPPVADPRAPLSLTNLWFTKAQAPDSDTVIMLSDIVGHCTTGLQGIVISLKDRDNPALAVFPFIYEPALDLKTVLYISYASCSPAADGYSCPGGSIVGPADIELFPA